MVSMDGPNVNLSLLGILKAERKEGGQPDLIDIGICNQRVLHNAFKHGAEKNGWELNKLLSAAYYVFHNSTYRRDEIPNLLLWHMVMITIKSIINGPPPFPFLAKIFWQPHLF